jgi:hypothetical protein
MTFFQPEVAVLSRAEALLPQLKALRQPKAAIPKDGYLSGKTPCDL